MCMDLRMYFEVQIVILDKVLQLICIGIVHKMKNITEENFYFSLVWRIVCL